MAELIMFLAALTVPDNISTKIRLFQKKLFSENIIIPSFGFDVLCPLRFYSEKPGLGRRIETGECSFSTGNLSSINADLFLDICYPDISVFNSFITSAANSSLSSSELPFPVYSGLYLGKLTDRTKVPVLSLKLACKNISIAILELNIVEEIDYFSILSGTVLERKVICYK